MKDNEIYDFAKDQQKIYTKDSQMGEFLEYVLKKLSDMSVYVVGDIVYSKTHQCYSVLLDDCGYDDWYVLTENGCVESWSKNNFYKIGHTELVFKN